MRTIFVASICCALLVSGCSRLSEQEILSQAQKSRNEAKYADAFGYYRQYLEEYPRGSQRPQVLLNAASLCGNEMKEYKVAVHLYKQFIAEFPKDSSAGKALLLIGFIYANQINDIDSARSYYTAFIARYPENEIVPSIRIELLNLGKDPEKIIEEKLGTKTDSARTMK